MIMDDYDQVRYRGILNIAATRLFFGSLKNTGWEFDESIWVQRLDKILESRKKKVNFTLIQALKLCTGRTAHRGSRGIALLFLDHGTRKGWVVSFTSRPIFTPGKDLVPIVQEAGWAPGSVWTGAENLTPTGIRSPDRPARSQSLFRLSYRAQFRKPCPC